MTQPMMKGAKNKMAAQVEVTWCSTCLGDVAAFFPSVPLKKLNDKNSTTGETTVCLKRNKIPGYFPILTGCRSPLFSICSASSKNVLTKRAAYILLSCASHSLIFYAVICEHILIYIFRLYTHWCHCFAPKSISDCHKISSKYNNVTHGMFYVGPAPQTVAQHKTYHGPRSGHPGVFRVSMEEQWH